MEIVFKENIRIISISELPEGKCLIAIDRALNKVNSDTIEIDGTINYNETFTIYDIASDCLSFTIKQPFAGDEPGEILNTGHIYTDSANNISNFPAVLIENNKTSFVESNANKTITLTNHYYFQVIDLIDNHKAITKSKTLENAQDFVWNMSVKILTKAVESLEININVDETEIYQTVIDDGRHCIVAFSEIGIENR